MRLPIHVSENLGKPLKVRIRGCWQQVEHIIEEWTDSGQWWDGECEKRFFRIISNGGLYEIYKEINPQGRWFLYKVYD